MNHIWGRVLLGILTILELISVIMMFITKNFWGGVVHSLILLAYLFVGTISFRNLDHFSNQHSVHELNAYYLLNTDLALLIMITIHDFDHMRQAMNWGYTFTLLVLLVNLLVYLPGLLAIYLIGQKKYSGIIATIISGPLIALSFLKIHLFGAWLPVWGPWNKSFFALHVDELSWGILILTAIVGVIVAMIGTYFLGKENSR